MLAVPEQFSIAMEQIAADVREGLLALAVATSSSPPRTGQRGSGKGALPPELRTGKALDADWSVQRARHLSHAPYPHSLVPAHRCTAQRSSPDTWARLGPCNDMGSPPLAESER